MDKWQGPLLTSKLIPCNPYPLTLCTPLKILALRNGSWIRSLKLNCKPEVVRNIKAKRISTWSACNGSKPPPCISNQTSSSLYCMEEKPVININNKFLWSLLHNSSKVLLASLLSSFFSATFFSGIAYATSNSLGASKLGLRIAGVLRQSGWADDLIVFTLASLPVLELRGAIPVGHWMKLPLLKIYTLAVLGNMVPVPLILLFLNRVSITLGEKSEVAKRFLDNLFENTRQKAGPIKEFRWIGLMLFVAVPFPGTGAWTGAIAAVVLGMPFWSALLANFFGVVIAGLLVNFLVTSGLKQALIMGIILFGLSTFMWGFLRSVKKLL